MINIFTIFQPFSAHPKKRKLLIGILCIWVVSICLALLPVVLVNDGHVYSQSVVVKNNPYFKTWNVNFDTLKSFAIKLLTFHPDLKNASLIERKMVANSASWKELEQFIEKLMPGSVEIGSSYGYVALYLLYLLSFVSTVTNFIKSAWI